MGSVAMETSCGYLLHELQMIWDEVGEAQFHREKVLLDLEQECLEVYRRKVDGANVSRARLHRELAESEAELTRLLLSLGEQRSLPGRPEKVSGTLKEQLDAITPALREMRLRKEDRVNQFRNVQGQIQKISAEIAGLSLYDDPVTNVTVNENDLSMKKLEEYQSELQRLHNEKNDRLQQVEMHTETIRNLCSVLGMESSMIITKVHPTLNDLCGITKNISDTILAKLSSTVESLKEEKQKRTEKLIRLGKALTTLWNLIDTPYKDRHRFFHVTNLLRTPLSLSHDHQEGSLALNIIQDAEAEVERLDQLKASKTKELFFRKRSELEEICSRSHMEVPSRSDVESIVELINSGEVDHANLLMSMDEQISKAKEEASSRKGIMEKAERWMLARDEECWLEEYSRDENRYSVSRGAHRNLRRAERARILVSKIPDLLGSVVARTMNWEDERSRVFLYDNVPLLEMVEEYRMLRMEKEQEKLRQKGMKNKVQVVQVTEPEEPHFSSRPGTSSSRSRPTNRSSNNGVLSYVNNPLSNRRLSMSSIQQFGNNGRKMHEITKVSSRHSMAPRFQDETASVVSTFSGPRSP